MRRGIVAEPCFASIPSPPRRAGSGLLRLHRRKVLKNIAAVSFAAAPLMNPVTNPDAAAWKNTKNAKNTAPPSITPPRAPRCRRPVWPVAENASAAQKGRQERAWKPIPPAIPARRGARARRTAPDKRPRNLPYGPLRLPGHGTPNSAADAAGFAGSRRDTNARRHNHVKGVCAAALLHQKQASTIRTMHFRVAVRAN